MEQSFITPLDTGTLQCGPAPVGSPYIYRFRHDDGGSRRHRRRRRKLGVVKLTMTKEEEEGGGGGEKELELTHRRLEVGFFSLR